MKNGADRRVRHSAWLHFARLSELHAPSDPEMTPVVHRGLSPNSIQVRHDNTPLFSGWRWARLPDAQTITAPTDSRHSSDPYAAPEVGKNGLSFADARSDVYSLCKALLDVLPPTERERALSWRVARGDRTRSAAPTQCGVDCPHYGVAFTSSLIASSHRPSPASQASLSPPVGRGYADRVGRWEL